MRIGLLADIHEHVERLRAALDRMERDGVDQVVVLGDCVDTFGRAGRARETIDLLAAAGAVGVWGNHDIGLCHDVPDSVRAGCDPAILDFMTTLKARLSIASYLFTHVEPWLDPYDPAQLWRFDGLPDTVERAARSFDTVADRFLVIGHLHRWLAMTPRARLDWNGARPLRLGDHARALVVIGPVFRGCGAILDTDDHVLHPFTV